MHLSEIHKAYSIRETDISVVINTTMPSKNDKNYINLKTFLTNSQKTRLTLQF